MAMIALQTISRVTLIALVAVGTVCGQAPDATQTPASGTGVLDQHQNSSSATKDNSGISGDQVTKPSGAKSSTLIGCLGGPDAEGHFLLSSMQHRTGVVVLGPDDLKDDVGKKLKLTGSWQPSPAGEVSAGKKPERRFQATHVDIVATSCEPPGTTTPSKKK
jgi:hypothetical protein